jgi:hypothetical protein
VAVAIHDPKNPYRYIQLRGKIVERPRGGPRRTRINLRGNTTAKTLSCARAYPVSSTR